MKRRRMVSASREETASTFVNDPLSLRDGERLHFRLRIAIRNQDCSPRAPFTGDPKIFAMLNSGK